MPNPSTFISCHNDLLHLLSPAETDGTSPTPAVSPSLFTSPTRIWASCGIVVPMFQIDVTGVFVSFIQPKIICNSALASDQEARFFGGIDGYDVSTIHHVGTDVLSKTRGGRSPSTLEYRRVQAVSQQS